MLYRVLLTNDASKDLEDLLDFIAARESTQRAAAIQEKIEEVILASEQNPSRGSFPSELLALGIRDFREVFFKPYRIIYRVIEKSVYILLIVDGRRDTKAILERRILRPE